MEPGGREPDQRVAGLDPLTADDRVQRHQSDCRAAQIPAGDDVAHLGDLAAGDLDPRQLGSGAKPGPDLPAHLGIGLAAEDEVQHRDRLGADADQVVHVHRDAVDADGVEPTELLGDDHLGADPVGAERDPRRLVEAQDARIVAGQRDDARGLARVDLRQVRDQGGDGGVGVALAHARGRVGVLAHRPPFKRKATAAARPMR
jgi:hypothetical protein